MMLWKKHAKVGLVLLLSQVGQREMVMLLTAVTNTEYHFFSQMCGTLDISESFFILEADMPYTLYW